jgi:hypothetical protein
VNEPSDPELASHAVKLFSALAVAVLLLAGCGGGSDRSYAGINALAKAMGCHEELDTGGRAPEYAESFQYCETRHWGHNDVGLVWFNSNSARDSYVRVGSYGTSRYVVGKNWAIECTTKGQQSEAAKLSGGTVRRSS